MNSGSYIKSTHCYCILNAFCSSATKEHLHRGAPYGHDYSSALFEHCLQYAHAQGEQIIKGEHRAVCGVNERKNEMRLRESLTNFAVHASGRGRRIMAKVQSWPKCGDYLP